MAASLIYDMLKSFLLIVCIVYMVGQLYEALHGCEKDIKLCNQNFRVGHHFNSGHISSMKTIQNLFRTFWEKIPRSFLYIKFWETFPRCFRADSSMKMQFQFSKPETILFKIRCR
jgi:hypothetical protein